MRLAVFASGHGTLIPAIHAVVPITAIIVDRPCGAEDVAQRLGIPVARALRSDFTRGSVYRAWEHNQKTLECLNDHQISHGALAGYRTIVGCSVIRYFGKEGLLNVHPSLLPLFPGALAVERAFNASAPYTGCTVHYVDDGVDTGPVVAQARVPVFGTRSPSELRTRIQTAEKWLYPVVIRDRFCE